MRFFILFSVLVVAIQLQAQSAKRMYPIYRSEFDSLIEVQDSLLKEYNSAKRWTEINYYQVADRFTYLENLQKMTSLKMNAELDSLKQVYLFLTGTNHEIRFRRKFSIYGQMDTVRVAITQKRHDIDSAYLIAKSISDVKLPKDFDDLRKVKEKNLVLLQTIDSLKHNNNMLERLALNYKKIDADHDYLNKLNVRLEDSISWWKYRFEKINQEIKDDIRRLRFDFERNGPNGFSNNYFVVFPDIHEKPIVKQNKKPKKGEVLLPDEELTIQYKTEELMSLDDSNASSFVYKESPIIKVDETVFYEIVDEPAVFPGGIDSLRSYLKNNLVYPPSVKNSTIQGRVYFRLKIDKNGAIADVYIQKPIENCPECSEAVKDLVANMPKWRPARIDGKNVNSSFVYFVKFNMD